MPELPEVEIVRRGLARAMTGAVFSAIEARRPDLRFPLPKNFIRRLRGAAVEALGRRGKYLTASLSSGETLIMHLGMSGRFSVAGPDAASRTALDAADATNPLHDHVRFWMKGPNGSTRIDYNDPRRFGFMDIVDTQALDRSAHFRRMGPEPMSEDFTPEAFHAALAKRAAPIKAALLDQRIVAGLGNIYVSEALFGAGLSPRRRSRNVGRQGAFRLREAIRATLAAAIDAGGSTLRDFAGSDGALGYFQHRFRVYGREGEPCPVCKSVIRRIVQAGRSTYYCGACQR